MIKAFIGGLTQLIAKPFYFLPALIAMTINTLILAFSTEQYTDFLYNALILGEVPETSMLELPFYLITIYGVELFIIALGFFVSTLLGFYLLYVYANLVRDKQALIKAILSNTSKLTELIGLTIFVLVATLLYSTVAFFLFILSLTLEIIGLVIFLLFLIWIVFGIYAFVKLVFTPLIMVLERKKLKPALAQSWKWTEKKALKILFFLIILGFIVNIINAIFLSISELVGIEIIGVAILIFGLALSNAYYNIVFIKYFLNSK